MDYNLPVLNLRLSEFARPTRNVWHKTVFRALAFPFRYEKLRGQARDDGMSWASWLARQFLVGLHRDRGKRDVLIGYKATPHLPGNIVTVYCLTRSTRAFHECKELLSKI